MTEFLKEKTRLAAFESRERVKDTFIDKLNFFVEEAATPFLILPAEANVPAKTYVTALVPQVRVMRNLFLLFCGTGH